MPATWRHPPWSTSTTGFILASQDPLSWLQTIASDRSSLRFVALFVAYARTGQELVLVYRQLGLRFNVHDIIYQNLIVAIALFAATAASPGRIT